MFTPDQFRREVREPGQVSAGTRPASGQRIHFSPPRSHVEVQLRGARLAHLSSSGGSLEGSAISAVRDMHLARYPTVIDEEEPVRVSPGLARCCRPTSCVRRPGLLLPVEISGKNLGRIRDELEA